MPVRASSIRQVLFPILTMVFIGLFPHQAGAEQPFVKNGNFERWNGLVPEGWRVEMGAKNGADRPESEVKQIPGPALMLRGNAKTMAWRNVSQVLNVSAGQTIQLEFDARSKDVIREGRQYDNCHVALMSTDQNGKVVGRAVQDVSETTADWKHFSVDYKVPEGASKTVVYVFLSKTGIIWVKGVKVTRVAGSPDAMEAEQASFILNGQFQEWEEGVPASWTSEIAAKNGNDNPESEINPLAPAGVVLSGNARTMAWKSLGQDLTLAPGKSYSLSFQASTEGVKREGRQYDNCYVGVMHFDASGERLDMGIKDLSMVGPWSQQTIRFTPPAATAKSKMLIFLSKSGRLKIKDVLLKEATPEKPFR